MEPIIKEFVIRLLITLIKFNRLAEPDIARALASGAEFTFLGRSFFGAIDFC